MNRKKCSANVIVAGGGATGALASICAARAGAKVILIEKESYLGGMAVGSMKGQLTGCGLDGVPMLGGTVREIVDKLIGDNEAEYYPMRTRTRPGNVLLLRYNIEAFKHLLESYVIQAGVTILYNSVVQHAEESEKACKVEVRGLYDVTEIDCKLIIDSTGNASVANLLGHETTIPPVGERFPAALIFKLGNVDFEKLKGFDWVSVRERWYKEGILPSPMLALAPCPNTNEAIVNVTYITGVDQESTAEMSQAYITLRQQVADLVPALKKNVPGLENSFLSATAPVLGIRDARKIVAKYQLTGDDVKTMRDFEDAVTPSSWPIDVHLPDGGNVWYETEKPYKIPYRVMVPKDGGRLLVTGRSIDADETAFSSARVIPTCMGLGEAAGEAAAIAVAKDITFDKVDGTMLSGLLRAKGVQV